MIADKIIGDPFPSGIFKLSKVNVYIDFETV
jgi:hypothetical protein